MPIFDDVRERLPSLYRPGDDDTIGDLIPLKAGDIMRINGAAVAPGALTDLAGTVRVTLPARTQVREIRVAPGVMRGSLLNLELYRVAGESALPVPGAVGRLDHGIARPGPLFEEQRFHIRLRRPDLLSQMMWAVARVLERTQVEATEVMRAHWFEYADQARYDPFFARTRELEGLGSPDLNDPDLLLFPYIQDLSRIGSLLALLPWREPAAHRERVEDYRQRISRMVELYRNGLGTVGAMRRMTEAQLPVDLTAPAGLRDRPFTVEEYARIVVSKEIASTRGAPTGIVGPLMRWNLQSDGHFTATPTVLIVGVSPEAGKIDATVRPVIERFSVNGTRSRIGIAYDGTLAPDQALRLRPAYTSWVARAAGLASCRSAPAELSADPTAPGPWAAMPSAPEDGVTAMLQTTDAALWVASVGADEVASLHRFDGQTWTEALTGLGAVEAMIEDGSDLLLATVAGLRRMPLFPAEGDPFSAGDEPGDPAVATHALLRAADGMVYVGTAAGLSTLGPADALTPFVLGTDEDSEVEVFGLHQDATGTLHIACALGLLRFQPGLGHWYWYRGEERSDQHPDFDRFHPEASPANRNFPSSDDVFLPPVRCVHRGPDASLWIGTERGIARYLASPVRGLTYTTLLQAYPDLGDGRVTAIREDERGMMWFATENGLFRFDDRDWWQMQGDALVRLPTPDPTPPRQWRFNRALDRWESFDTRSSLWSPFTGTARAAEEAPVVAITWTDEVAADLGSWNGTAFTVDADAELAPLRMRYKPEETRIVGGGIPAIPRIPPTPSVWRYLSLEQEPVLIPASTPAWTIEGRLLPPPPSRDPVLEGRYSANAPLDLSQFDEAAFAFNPAARIWMSWDSRHPLAVLVRLRRLEAGERIDPAILDRVWQGIGTARPAGVRTVLAVDEEIVRGGS